MKNRKKTEMDMSPTEMDKISAGLFYQWAKEDGTLEVDNIAYPEKLKPFKSKKYISLRQD